MCVHCDITNILTHTIPVLSYDHVGLTESRPSLKPWSPSSNSVCLCVHCDITNILTHTIPVLSYNPAGLTESHPSPKPSVSVCTL